MLERICHPKFGLGVVVSEGRSQSGLPVATVVFDDSPETERTILSQFLAPSDKRLPASAKTVVKKKRVPKPKPEPVSDGLLYELKDKYLADDSESLLESAVEE